MTSKIKCKWSNIPITVKVSTAYAICGILQHGLSFFTLPIFSRMLTEEQYGMYIVYQSWYSILSIFLTLNLAYGSFSRAMIKYEKDRDGYIASVEGICIAIAGAFFLLYLPFQYYWNKLFELPTMLVCVMVAEILGTTAIQFWSGKKRFEFKYKSVVAVTLIITFLSPFLTYFMVINTESKGHARILGYAIVNILIGWSFFVFSAVRGKKLFNKEYWKYGFGFNIPLLAYYLSQVVFNQSDRIMIDHMIGRDKAAIYGVAYSLAMVLNFVLISINNAYVPWFYIKLKEGKPEEGKKVTLVIACLMGILLSGVVWLAPEILYVAAGSKYAEAVYVIPPVALSLFLLFYSQLFINIEFYYEKKKHLVYASLGSAVINLILNWIFIPIFGFIAAAYTTLVSYIIFVLANYVAMKIVLKENGEMDRAYSYKWLMSILFAFAVCTALGTLLYDFLYIRIAVVLVVMLIVIWNRKTVIENIKLVFRKGEADKDEQV